MDSETNSEELPSESDYEGIEPHTPLEQQKGILYRSIHYFDKNTCILKSSTDRDVTPSEGVRKTKRTRVILIPRLCLMLVLFYYAESKTSAFCQKHSSKRMSERTPNAKISWYGCNNSPYVFSLAMSQGDESLPDITEDDGNSNSTNQDVKKLKKDFKKRITRLEDIVSRQEVEIHRLKNTCAELTEVSVAFGQLIQLLRDAGLDAENLETSKISEEKGTSTKDVGGDKVNSSDKSESPLDKVIESYDDALIFGTAPSSVIDAADGAGAAILAAMLGGKQRMLVDVRDAELSNDPETLVQFIELAILPIAAGLEGLKSTRNRVKIVFPKVSQLLEYRRTMALAAPEVVALSTLGFDPVEKRDKLVVIVAPEPDDEEGIQAIRDLLTPSEEGIEPIQQPVVVLNYHMLPFSGVELDFETAYHLRLLSVQYMADIPSEDPTEDSVQEEAPEDVANDIGEETYPDDESIEENDVEDEALENAMKHAHEVGVNEGVTRAMVIRAYPRPWHIFVDLSPNTNADFEVAATFDKEPSMEELNFAIVECLEGSEREDEIVAQQMQQALEDGQLNKVSGMLSNAIGNYFDEDNDDEDMSSEEDEDDDFDMFEEDSV